MLTLLSTFSLPLFNHFYIFLSPALRTGKTTVARLIGRYLYAHGVLPRDTFVERNALALKGTWVCNCCSGWSTNCMLTLGDRHLVGTAFEQTSISLMLLILQASLWARPRPQWLRQSATGTKRLQKGPGGDWLD